jgi:PTH1 family peptidyl-tRNA hydrolase
MKIIAFLGNPGRKYAGNRHNIGFIIGEYFARRHGIAPSQKKFSALLGAGSVNGVDVCLVFPQTYMNASGEAVSQVMNFYKEEASSLIAVHDEIEFVFARFAMKSGGGHKGHNGIRSIMQQTGTGDFQRLRFGVGRPENPNVPVADYVLGNFLPEEMARIEELLPEVSFLLESAITG